ncbi:MAG: ribosome biogenesis GTPase Der [Spirochaetales bacterium]|nr:ribosome biogenesis GTPase Der [Spirochaetales bacterium]
MQNKSKHVLNSGWRNILISTPIKNNLPRIAIIGRPNVGKSTLFNRLLKKRRAITDPTPGVTRDSLEIECTIGDRHYLLVDTGGYTTEIDDYSVLVSAKSLESAKKADLILLMIDVLELTSSDLEFIEITRSFQDKTILVINKVDNEQREQLVWNLYELGFSRIVPVSALHGKNIDQLEEEMLIFLKTFTPRDEEEPEELLRIAILGKPNTGKSTLTNYLLGEEKSLVSNIPGTTRDVIQGKFLYKGVRFQVLDTAGIRRKKMVKDPVEYYSVNRAIGSIKDADIVFLLIDITEDISEQDKKIAAHAEKQGRGIIFVLNKWDLLPDIPNRLAAVKDKIRFYFPVLGFVPIFPISAISGEGVKELLQATFKVRKQLNTRIETGKLNKMVKTWMEYYPYKVKGREVRIKYATQASINPVKFIIFLNLKKGIREEFHNYIRNKIKKDFKMDMIPVKVDFR